jgi:aspartyl protease
MFRSLLALGIASAACWRLSAETASLSCFPFEFRDGLLWVRVSVPQSAQPLNFLLDSGAGVSAIHLRTAKALGLKLGQRVNVQGVASSAEGFWSSRLAATAGGVALPKDYLALDLAEVSRACTCCVDGLIGADFFQGRVVQIDFVEQRIRLSPRVALTGNVSVVDLKTRRGAMLAAVQVNDAKPQWLRVDTGCASCLQWVAGGTKGPDMKPSVSIGLTELNIPSATTTVKLGAAVFASIPAGLHRRPIFSGESGLLGNGLLARFERVTLDGEKGKLVLENSRPDF